MFEVLPETDPHLLAIRVGGKLTRQDYARLNPWLDEQLARHPRPTMLVDMRRFEGFEGPGALLDDMRSGVKHWGDVGRVAILADHPWVAWMVSLMSPLMRAEMRYFGPDQEAEAWAWARRVTAAEP